MRKPDEPLASVFCFEDFRLDAARRTLQRGGVQVDLRAKGFDLLTCLARNAGRVVTKNELIQAVWPGVVVTDESLTRCISDIRHALADGAQQIIKTVPRRGYVLVAPVSLGETLPAQGASARPGLTDHDWAPAPVAPIAAQPTAATIAPRVADGARARTWAHRWRWPGLLAAAVLVAAAAVAWKPWGSITAAPTPPLSIVVLPLVNLGSDAAQAWFAEGLTEDLTTDLSRIPGSFVIARSSADAYKGKAADVRQVGRDLGVRYALEGSVQRLDGSVRLNLRLIDAENGRKLWAERFDGSRDGMPALQGAVTGTVARTLHVQMVEAESQRSLRLRPRNPDAQDLAWQARSAMERYTPESNALARELLQRALALDASSASLWSALSQTYNVDVMMRWMNLRTATRDEWIARAGEAADKAMAIDSRNPDALGAAGKALQIRGLPEQSLAMYLRQIEANANDAPAWNSLGYAYATLGRQDESIAANERALRLSPRDGRIYGFLIVIAAAHLLAGRDAQALDWARRAIAAKPGYSISHAWAAAAAARLGDMATAHSALEEFRRLQPGYTLATFRAERHGNNAEFLRQRERFYEGLAKAGLAE